MSDDLTQRIADVLAAHFKAVPRDDDTGWFVCSGCGVEIETSGRHVKAEFVAHQAEMVRAVLGETTPQWGVRREGDGLILGPWTDRDTAEKYARLPRAEALITREVPGWTEVTP